jgi:hypothetical protein
LVTIGRFHKQVFWNSHRGSDNHLLRVVGVDESLGISNIKLFGDKFVITVAYLGSPSADATLVVCQGIARTKIGTKLLHYGVLTLFRLRIFKT